jgi:alpha-beta hydrolase superfamily lysophospholipase
MDVLTPHLSIESPSDTPEAVVLVLHGGREMSAAAVRGNQLAVLRMIPFARRITERADGRVAVARLRFAVRGWNAASGTPAPVTDTKWALQQLADRFGPLPVGLVGHSMGGRTALRCGGEPNVRGVVGLAPWLPPGEPSDQLADRRVLLMHGTADRMTSPEGTAQFADRLRAAGVSTSLVRIGGERHGMLHQPRLWHELAAQFVLRTVLADYEPSGWADAPNFFHDVITGTSQVSC